MPAAAATAVGGVPWMPRSAKTSPAAASTASRRSSAVEGLRGVVRVAAISKERVATHSFVVKGACSEPVRLALEPPPPRPVGVGEGDRAHHVAAVALVDVAAKAALVALRQRRGAGLDRVAVHGAEHDGLEPLEL